MSLCKRGSTWWIDVIAPNGERVRRSAGTANKALAREFHDKTKAELWRIAQLGDKPRRTWNDAVVRWLKEQSHKATAKEDVTKLRWLAEHQPDAYARAQRLCFLGDYFTQWLTGAHVTDGSVAGLSGLFAVEDWKWSDEWCGHTGVTRTWLPEVIRSGTAVGTIRPDAAAELGLPVDCLVTMGILDQYAGAIGVGNSQPGGLSETTGTVLATVRCSRDFPAPVGTDAFSGPAAKAGEYYHMMFGGVSASLLEYYRQQLPDRPDFDQLDLTAAGSRNQLHLDHRCSPEQLRSILRDWAARQSRGEVVSAIYQCVADALAAQVNALAGALPVELVRSAGGASRSRRWLQIKARTLRSPVLAPNTDEPTLLGVASLAAQTLGWDSLVLPETSDVSARTLWPNRPAIQ